MGDVSADSPSLAIPPRIQTPQTKMHPAASAQACGGFLISHPASISAGAANAVFIPAYNMALTPSENEK